MKIKKMIGGAIYYSIGIYLPSSRAFIFGGLGKYVRSLCCKLMLPKTGNNINVERGALFSSRCTIGNNSGIGINARLGVVHIGNNVLMGPECVILTKNHAFRDKNKFIREQGYSEEKPVYIGDDVWIGHRVIILPGVHIGNGTVIGAGAVVTKNTTPYSVVGGNPARILKMRE